MTTATTERVDLGALARHRIAVAAPAVRTETPAEVALRLRVKMLRAALREIAKRAHPASIDAAWRYVRGERATIAPAMAIAGLGEIARDALALDEADAEVSHA